MAEILAEIKKIPPVTRFLVLSSLGITIPVISGIVSAHRVIFITSFVTRGWEVWRIFTSLFFGTTQLSYLFHLVMLYRNSNSLESTHYERRSSDYAWQLFFASLGVVALNRPFNSVVHDHAFLNCITYLMCALSPPGAQTSVMGLITVPVKYLPYVFLAFDFFNGRAQESLTGMITGHLWWWLVWGSGTGAGSVERGRFAAWASAPMWLRDWFGERGGLHRVTNRSGYQVHAPARPGGQTTGGGRTTGYNWGSGHRLGSE